MTADVCGCSHHRKDKAAQEDLDKAMQMLSELRRTESSPNVEAEALKRNKGGGGPWLSFSRQRKPPKPRTAKKGPASSRMGSPLATVTSGDICLQSGAAPNAAGFIVRANNGNGAESDRHSHSKSVKPPFASCKVAISCCQTVCVL